MHNHRVIDNLKPTAALKKEDVIYERFLIYLDASIVSERRHKNCDFLFSLEGKRIRTWVGIIGML